MTDLGIIGGGLAGAALAIAMAGDRRVTLIERQAGPHDKVCGEFLSREAVLHLTALGIDPLQLGGAPIGRVRIAVSGSHATADLPFQAVGLSRRVLDEMMLERAHAAGAVLLRGRRVETLGDNVARLHGGGSIAMAQAVLATGKHDVRGWQRGPGRQNDLIGFKQHFRLARDQLRSLDGHVELSLFRGGYAGLQRVEDELATLCLVIRRARLAELGGGWAAVCHAAGTEAGLLRQRLADAEPIGPRPVSISRIPYGYLHQTADAAWRLGDQAAVIPSFTGDGMSIALHSAALAARLIRRGAGAAALQTEMRRDVGARVTGAALLSIAAVHRPAQWAAVAVARAAPALASWLAAATRVPDAALHRSGIRTA